MPLSAPRTLRLPVGRAVPARLGARCFRALGLSVLLLLVVLGSLTGVPGLPLARAQAQRHVDDDPGCQGKTPCYSSIQAAVDAAGDGDAVLIAPGRYREQVRVVDKSLSLRGPTAERGIGADDPALHAIVESPVAPAAQPLLLIDARSRSLDGPRVQGLRLRAKAGDALVLLARRPADPLGLPAGAPPAALSTELRGARLEDLDITVTGAAQAPPGTAGIRLQNLDQARVEDVTVRGAPLNVRVLGGVQPRLRDCDLLDAGDVGLQAQAVQGLVDLVGLGVEGPSRVSVEFVDLPQVWLHRSRVEGADLALRLVERQDGPPGQASEIRLGGSAAEGNSIRSEGPLALALVNERADAATMADVDARYNDWGSPYLPEIEDLLRHRPADPRLGRVEVLPPLGAPADLNLSADPAELVADGEARARILAMVRNAAGGAASDRSLALLRTSAGQLERPGQAVEVELEAVQREGPWQVLTDERFGRAWGGAYLAAATPGARLNWDFSAPALLLRYGLAPQVEGQFRVLIDGVERGRYDNRASARTWGERLLATGLAPGAHRLTLEVLDGELAVDALAAGLLLSDGRVTDSLKAPLELGQAELALSVYGSSDVPLQRRLLVPLVSGPPFSMSLRSDSALVAAGGGWAALQARLEDRFGRPVKDGTPVRFGTDTGEIEPVEVASAGGVARATYRSGTRPGLATLWAQAGAISATTTVTVTAGAPASVVLTSTQRTLPANSVARAPLLIQVRDAGGFAVADGTPVRLLSDLGSVEPPLVVTEGGDARAELVAGAAAGRATISASVEDLVADLSIDLEPMDLRLTKQVDPQGVVVPGERVTFSLRLDNLGSGTVYGISLEDPLPMGLVSPTLRASFFPRGPQLSNEAPQQPYQLGIDRLAPAQVAYITITSRIDTSLRWGSRRTLVNQARAYAASAAEARPEDNQAAASLDVVPGAAFTVTLTSPPELTVGGAEAQVLARVTDRGGRPAADGTAVFFSVDPPDLAQLQPAVVTTSEGRAVTRLISGPRAGRIRLRAITVGERAAQQTLRLTAGPPATLRLSGQADRLEVGGKQMVLTASLRDRFDNPVPDLLVRFRSDIGGLSRIDGLSNAAGQVTSTLTSGFRSGVARVRAEHPGLMAGLDIPFLPGPPASLSLSADNTQLKLGQSAQVAAVVRDLYANPVSGAQVSFAFDLGEVSPVTVGTGTDGLARSRIEARETGVGLLEARVAALQRSLRVDVQGRRIFLPRMERRR